MENEIDVRIIRILRRIRGVIADAVRVYESNGSVNNAALNIAKQNLIRISRDISVDTYRILSEGIEALLLINSYGRQQQGQGNYVAPRVTNGYAYNSLLGLQHASMNFKRGLTVFDVTISITKELLNSANLN